MKRDAVYPASSPGLMCLLSRLITIPIEVTLETPGPGDTQLSLSLGPDHGNTCQSTHKY